MKSMLQFVAVMEKLIQMIAMLKMQVSRNGPKVSVNEKQNCNPAPHSWGFLYVYIYTPFKVFEKKVQSFLFVG